MQDENVQTAPAAEGIPETGREASNPPAQAAGGTQEATAAQVESDESKATSTVEPQRPKASEYYRSRESGRRQMESAMRKISEMEAELKALKANPGSSRPEAKKPSADELKKKYWEQGPENFTVDLLMKMQEIEEKYNALKEKELPSLLSQHSAATEFERRTQEAMEMLFPKSNPEDKSTWEERGKKDVERAKRIDQIMKDYGFDQISERDPEKAARGILAILDKPVAQARNPLAPKKSQMASTSTGSPIGGGNKMPNAGEVRSEFEKMSRQIHEDPALMRDEKFMDKWNTLKQSMLENLK